MLLNRQHLNETKRSDERYLIFFVELDFCQEPFFKKIRSIFDNFLTFDKITLFLKGKFKKNKNRLNTKFLVINGFLLTMENSVLRLRESFYQALFPDFCYIQEAKNTHQIYNRIWQNKFSVKVCEAYQNYIRMLVKFMK